MEKDLVPSEAMESKSESKLQRNVQPSFKSKELEELLDVIDCLRQQGIASLIDLPQLIVCGDQSSGKSSVLEALSGVSFPTRDNLCTRHPTELVLRRKPESNTAITIIPDVSRSDKEKHRLSEFKAGEEALHDFGATVEAAGKEMGLQDQTRTFSTDVLRVELTGPTMPQLTLVDLPGLFHSGSKSQTDADASVVRDMITGYMKKQRSIILAIVSAKNEYVNQVVTKYARDVDPNGIRTLGIITKPDLLDEGSHSERQYLELAENKDVVLRLGWHVLRNRDYKERNNSLEKRNKAEMEFFASGIWAPLGHENLGVDSLQLRLGRILRDHILTELPNLTRDIENGIKDCQDRLSKLGAPRATKQEQRKYLHQISQAFSKLVRDAIDGHYTDEFFDSCSSNGLPRRIRAVVANLLEDFAQDMRTNGKYYVITDQNGDDLAASDKSLNGNKTQGCNLYVAREDYLKHVAELLRENRGRELPGFTKFETVTTLFKEQCQPWGSMVRKYTEDIFDAVNDALRAVLDHASDQMTKEGILNRIIDPAMINIKAQLDERVAQNLQQHINGHPITYNHYFTENIQKLRNEHQAEFLKQKIHSLPNCKSEFASGDVNSGLVTVLEGKTVVDDLVSALTNNTVAAMNRFACSEAVHFTEAYYKVARKFFVDDFSIHAIEQGLLQPLQELFNPADAFGLSDEEIGKIAGEGKSSKKERSAVSARLASLKEAIKVIRQLDYGRPKNRV